MAKNKHLKQTVLRPHGMHT